MDHRKSPPLSETSNYLENNDMTTIITSEEQDSEACTLGVKSSKSHDKPTENKNDLDKQNALEQCTSPEPTEINNFPMNERIQNTINPHSQSSETCEENDTNLKSYELNENRIFGRTSDNLRGLNTEAVKFSFGSCVTETPYKEAIVFSARDRNKNQYATNPLKQNTLKLRKPEETAHRNINDLDICNDREQSLEENVTFDENIGQVQQDFHMEQNFSKEITSPTMKPPKEDNYCIQRQNEGIGGSLEEHKVIDNPENLNTFNEKDMTTLSFIADAEAENTETICKTCLAIQAAEKYNYKSFSVVIDTFAEVKQQPTRADISCDEKQHATIFVSQKSTDENVCEKSEPHQITDSGHETTTSSVSEQCMSSWVKEGSVKTKTEQILTDYTTVSSSAAKNINVEQKESDTVPNTQTAYCDSIQPKSSVSSEDSQGLDNDSQASVDSQITDKQKKVKKQRHGWFSRLFLRLHKQKPKKVIECDIVSAPSKSRS